MSGTFRIGDYLHINSDSIDNILPGDVVVYRGKDYEGEEKELVQAKLIRPIGSPSLTLIQESM